MAARTSLAAALLISAALGSLVVSLETSYRTAGQLLHFTGWAHIAFCANGEVAIVAIALHAWCRRSRLPMLLACLLASVMVMSAFMVWPLTQAAIRALLGPVLLVTALRALLLLPFTTDSERTNQ